MATLTNNGSSLVGDITINKKEGTVLTLQTERTYVEDDCQFTIDVQSATVQPDPQGADVDISDDAPTAGGVNISDVIGEKASSEPSSGYYFKATASGSGGSTVTQPGWIDSGALASSAATASKYFPVTGGTVTASGGELTKTDYSGTPTVGVTLDAQTTTGVTISDTAPSSGEYLTLTGTSGALSGSTAVTRADVKDVRTAGYIPARNSTTTISGDTISPSVTVNSNSKTRYVSIPTGAQTVAGGGLTAGAGSSSAESKGYYNGSSYVTTDKVTMTETEAAGYYKIETSGSGTVNRAAITKQVTTAGYFPADGSPVQQSAATSASSNTAKKNYFIKKATNEKVDATVSAVANAGTASITKQPSANASVTATANGMDGGYYTDSTTSSYYVDVNASASSASGVVTATGGSARASVTESSATVSDGYNPSSVTTSTTASDSGQKTGNTSTTTEATASDSKNAKIYLKPAIITQNAPTVNSSTGLVTATATTTAGYTPAKATAASNTLQLTTKGATTYNASTSEQSIPAGTYLTGEQTIRAITTEGIDASNIKDGATITVGDSGSATRIENVTGTFTDASTVSTGQTAATEDEILSGYSAWVDGAEVKGAIAMKSSSDLGVSGATVTVPAGYYAVDASASVASGSVTQNTPTINTSTGLVTATSTVTSGYVSASTPSKTLQLSALGATTYNVSTTGYEIAAGKYLTGKQTIRAVMTSGIDAGNIKHGTTVTVGDDGSATRIKNVTGTFTKANTVSSGQTAAAAGQIRSGYSAWVDGAEVKGSLGNTSVSMGITTVSSGTATRGDATWGNGVISSGSMGAATFNNTATEGKTYVDISSTADAPVLVSGGFLYIDKGYTDDLKISLAKLVPDGASANLASGVILSGYSAYNNDGTLVAGNIPTKTSLTVNGKTVTAPAGYYASDTSTIVAVGKVTSGTATINSLTRTYNSTNDNFTVTGSADVSAPTANTAGYISSSEGTRSKNTGGATVSATVAKIVGSTAITGTTTKKPSITKQSVPSGVTNAASGDATTTAPSSGVYVAVKSAANTGTLTATPSVTTAGYGTADYHGIAGNTATVGAQASDTTYVPITTTSASVSGRTVSYGSGWITEGSKQVALGTVTSGSATIDSATFSYNSTAGNFSVTGSKAIGAPTVGTAGYISSTEGTKNGNTASLATTVAKIVGSTSITGTTTKKPSITKQATPSGVTNAASGDATTTAPSSGVYVAVKSAANTGTLTATPSVTTAGYGTADYHGITGNTATVGAQASDTTYVPITTTSASVSGKTVSYGSGWISSGSTSVADGAYNATVAHSISTTPVVTGALSGKITTIGTTTKPSGTDGTDYWSVTPGVSLTTTGKSTATGTATISTAGYLGTGSKDSTASTLDITPTRNNGTTRYLTKATSSTSNGTATATAGTASTSVTGMVTTTTNTGYSVSASATGGNASVTASSVTVGAGYNPSSVTASTTAASNTGESASDTKYIQKGVLSASVSSNSGGSASMAATGFTASGTATSYYVTLSTSAGSVKAKAQVGTEGYVKSETNETAATSVAVSGNGNKLYIPAGGYAGSVSSHSISTTPVVTGAISGTVTDIGTTTQPSSGTDGTDYWTITPGGSVTTTGVSTAKGKATISTAGYIPTGNKESSASTVNITPTVSNGSARYLTKATSSTSNGTATATNGTASATVTGMATTTTDTGYSVSASATGGNASVTASSVTVGVGYNPSSVTASTTAKSATGTSASTTKYIQKGVLSASVSSNSGGSASMAASGFTASSSATSYYVTLSTSAGSVKAKASVGTEGYVKSETNETAATSVAVSGNGNKLYIPAGGITPTVANSGLSTYFNSGTSSDKNLTLTPQYTNTAGYIPAHSTAQSGTASYYKIKTTSASVSGKTVSYGTGWITSGSKSVADGTMTQGTTTVSGETATRGTLSWTAGYFTASSLGAATFANEATSGTTYVDISGTTAAPVLVAGDYLYINKGYVDDVKISLSRLVPDGSDVKGHGDYILSGHSAYDNDGTLVAGSIATLTASDVTVSGRTVTIPTGKYTGGTAISKSVANGSVTPAVNSHTITAPTATGSLSGTVTDIGTTTKPSGTDGTDYWTITPGVTSVKGSSVTNAKATVSAGYIASSPANSGNSTKDITVTTSNGTARYLTKATSSTSNGTATATNGTASTSVTGMVTTTTNTGYSVSASATGGNASVTASSVTVNAGYNPSSVTASTTAKSATGTSASDTKYIQKGALSASVSSNSGGSASMSATGFTAASDATSYYVTLATTAGSVKAKAQVGTEGYVKSETNETSATSVAVSGNGTKLYIPAGAYSSSVASQGTNTAAAFTPKTTGTITDISTTTAPSSGTDGTDYWTITPDGDKTTGKARAKATATIGTAGYIPTGSSTTSSYTTWNITTNVNAGTARYISKATTSTTNGTATATAGTASTSVTGMVTTTTNTGYSVSASATGGDASVTASSATVNVGYNPSAVTASTTAKSATGTSASDTKYIQKGVLSASVSSNSGGSASMAATGFTASSSATSYYVTLSTSAGSVKAKASVGTEGYVKSETNETSATSVSVSGNGTKLYIPAGGITPSISNSGLSTYFNSGTSSDKNLTLTPQYTNTAGYIPAHSTAQSGTAAYYKIKTASPTFSSPTPSGGSTATGTNCTLGSSNTSGISVQTKYSVNAASFTYNAAVEGWVSKASGASAGSTTARGSTNGTNYYLTGVSIPKPSGDTPNQFTVTVPNGSGTINFVFNVDKNGNVTVTES